MRGISFAIPRAQIFGLIGPDGAGKTSTFQILAGVMEATVGRRRDLRPSRARDARAQTGYLTQTFSLYPDLTVKENIQYIGDLRRVPRDEIDRRGHRYLQMFDMDRFSDRLAGRLSGGMKQKLALACALVPEPRVLLLDEPTTGVDPVSRREFWDALAHLAADGLTILVATPYLDEAERCHRVALMHAGVIQQIGTPDEIARQPRAPRGWRCARRRSGAAEQALSAVSGDGTAASLDVQRFGDRLDVLVREPEQAERDVQRRGSSAPAWRSRKSAATSRCSRTSSSLRLHALGLEVQHPSFPGPPRSPRSRGSVAIGAANADEDVRIVPRGPRRQRCRCATAKSTGCSARTAPARRRRSRCSAACSTRRAVRSSWPASGGACARPRSGSSIGYMSQKFSLYDDLPIDENLEFFAGVYGVPEDERAREDPLGDRASRVSKARTTSWSAACRADGSSASRSARPSCTSRASCFSTSRPRASTRSPGARSGG